MPENEVDLHRLVWSPDDFEDGRLLTSAFRRQDLSGGDHDYVSVSRVDQIDTDAEIRIANDQGKKAGSNNLVRDEAWSIFLNCGEVRSVRCSENQHPFEVTDEPIPDENNAHCGIRNASGENGRGYVNQLRVLLVSVSKGYMSAAQFFEKLET